MTNVYRLVALGAMLALVAGCTTGPAMKDGDSPELQQRAVQRWEYLIAHKAEKAYDYLSPGYRETVTRDAYASAMNSRPVRWTGVKYHASKCDGDHCAVSLFVEYLLPMNGVGHPVESGSPQQENWIRVRGTWYFLPST